MIFDTDIFIWLERGNLNALELVDSASEKVISMQTYMELLQGAQSKKHLTVTRKFLYNHQFKILPITENISYRAAIYVESFALSNNLNAGDALIAATAIEYNQELVSANIKHFKCIPNLNLKIFKP